MVPSCCTYSTAFHLDITSYQGAEASAAGRYSAGWHKTRGAATKLGVRQLRGCPGGIRCGLGWPAGAGFG